MADTSRATGILVLADGTAIRGHGFGAQGVAVGEACFNTAMTGYQEVMTDPSYAAQIIAFTFPHIGNVGVNPEDIEAINPHAVGCIVREDVTAPSNWRSTGGFDAWMKLNGRIGLAGVDTRALTRRIRERGDRAPIGWPVRR
jgi:carbamoyl-phosphate synthase small subunit